MIEKKDAIGKKEGWRTILGSLCRTCEDESTRPIRETCLLLGWEIPS